MKRSAPRTISTCSIINPGGEQAGFLIASGITGQMTSRNRENKSCIIPRMIYIALALPPRGVFRDVLKMERGAVPPGGLVTRTGAARGSAWGSLRIPRQELADQGANALESAARDCKEAASGAPRGEGPDRKGPGTPR
jgi:hypothetical protein